MSALPPSTPSSPLTPRPEMPAGSLASVVDTIESIIIALVLALTFRAFVVEAFVIPTGSMAPTLLGAHFDNICPRCGWEFKENANLNLQWDQREGRIRNFGDERLRGELVDNSTVVAPARRTCPNCGYQISADPRDGQMPDHPLMLPWHGRDYYYPWTNNGDRILVLKYLYDFVSPKRWDVIVFKEPMTARDNYIKRLIGLPGETVEIIEGDVFITPPGADRNDRRQRLLARKPPQVQEAVWQLVFDNDYYPTDAGDPRTPDEQKHLASEWRNPWQGESGSWTIGSPEIRHEGSGGAVLKFVPTEPFYLYNVLGYNVTDVSAPQGHSPVGDLRVEMVWTAERRATDAVSLRQIGSRTLPGEVALVVGMLSNQVAAAWYASGKVAVSRRDPGTGKFVEMAAATVAPPQSGRTYRLALNNVDRQAQFFIDGKQVVAHESPWSAEDALAWAKQLEAHPEKPEVRVEVAGPCTLGHVKLFRDLYYTQAVFGNDPNKSGTATMKHPVTLGQGGDADEFFALGDNSIASFDSRGWNRVDESLADLPTGRDEHFGCIPRRFLLGRAFFVYWPAGFRPMNGALGPGRSPLLDPPLVPNTGEMRFIR